MMIGFGISEVNFSISGVLFVVTSIDLSWVQKKENSDDCFGCRDDGDEMTFDGEVISFDSSASEFQKKVRRQASYMESLAMR